MSGTQASDPNPVSFPLLPASLQAWVLTLRTSAFHFSARFSSLPCSDTWLPRDWATHLEVSPTLLMKPLLSVNMVSSNKLFS